MIVLTRHYVKDAMSTTSYTLPNELQERATAAAEELGVSTHDFILDAIRKAADSVEQRADFVAEALTAREEMVRSGKGVEPDDVRAYFRNRSINKDTPKPEPKPWRK